MHRLTFCAVLATLAALAASGADAQSFQHIGAFRPTGVSADGDVVSGRRRNADPNRRQEAVRWTPDGGIQSLRGLPPFFDENNAAYAVSADGTVVVGDSYGERTQDNTTYFNDFAVRWVGAADAQDLGVLPYTRRQSTPESIALAVSADGSVVVGYSESPWDPPGGSGVFERDQATRWEGGTLTGLGWLEGGSLGDKSISVSRGVSADGSVVVGYSSSVSMPGCASREYGCFEAFRWVDGVIEGLGSLGGESRLSQAYAVSADGSVVVGRTSVASGAREAFRWENGVMQSLGQLPGGTSGSTAFGVSADGSIIIGVSDGVDQPDDESDPDVPFLWTAETGMRPLRDVLIAQDLDLSGWTLTGVAAISANGAVIVGLGDGPFGEDQAWRAELERPSDIIVNDDRDLADVDDTDGVCDAVEDAVEAGLQCTLRAAIETANARDGASISFEIEIEGTPVLRPQTALPTITASVTIDATTQPGGMVHLSGEGTDVPNGLVAFQADDLVVRGFAITQFDQWGITIEGGEGHRIERSAIGFLPGAEGALAENGLGGILIKSGATGAVIGGLEEADENRIYGGIVVLGDDTRGVQILRNELAVYFGDAGVARVPIDLGDSGPTCAAWEPTGTGPNGGMAAPRLLSITSTVVEGQTQPGSTVVIYRTNGAIAGTGIGRGRYWPASVLPVGIGEADGEGHFSIALDETLSVGTQVTATATRPGGDTSELAQLRRPVIYVPGIGGSWLKAFNGDNIWVPITTADKNDRLARMSMLENGTSVEPLDVDGVIELGGFKAYGPALASLRALGYLSNAGRADNDLWPFPYDWRTNTADHAHRLRSLVDELTGVAEDVAVSCEVDLIAHSNGGLVSGIYVQRDATHARDHVHRFITVASPYLGADKAAAAHSIGYVFDVEESLRFTVDWGRMIGMARNVTGIYGLLPSRAYWDVVNRDSPAHRHGYLFQDLYGQPLLSYDATAAFLAAPKVDAANVPRGLARNGPMFAQQQTEVHDILDDWREWSGPPQIFRQVGAIAASTPTGWRLNRLVDVASTLTPRSETDDTVRHAAWRESLQPILGWGDVTVPLVSATLGADRQVGAVDLSGVDSPWIEPFEYYSCTHTGIIEAGCRDQLGGPIEALVSVERMLLSGYIVLAEPAGRTAGASIPGAEVLYVSASGPVTVTVEDALGNRTGPASQDDYRTIVYEVPGIGYWPSEYGATVSVPTGGAYTLTVEAPTDGITTRVSRLQVAPSDESRRNVLFADQTIARGGALRLALEAAGTADTAPLALDADGDGAFESTLAPGAVFTGSVGYPAVPSPVPSVLELRATGETAVTAELVLPDVGASGWTWTLAESAAWITPSATSGAAPATIVLDVAAETIAGDLAETTMLLSLRYDGYEVTVPVPVELRIGALNVDADEDANPAAFALSAPAPNPTRDGAVFQVAQPTSGPARVEVYDALGRRAALVHDGPLAAGTHGFALDTSRLPAGVYVVRAVTPGGSASRTLTVVR